MTTSLPGSRRPLAGTGQVQTALIVGLGVALAILLLLGWLSLQDAEETLANAQEVGRSFQLLGSLDAVLGRVTDAETASRGFVITGSAGFLDPYHAAVAALPAELTHLDSLLEAADPLQRRFGVELDSLIADKLRFIALVTGTRRNAGLRPAASLVSTQRGKEAMDSIRRSVAQIETRQRARLAAGELALETTEQRLKLIIVLGTAAALAVAVMSTLALRRELSNRVRAELALRHSEEALKRSEEQLLKWVVDRREPPAR